ncbi:hypothetical protein LOK74_10525 [Brevibacillus humidisoli]|uniref:hypothetical protein n=1 Tax=Brevibacillus humidisoli TaxID=2895522 RepID=UPI001E30416D|nr:hypothetical protein [Brevibacillus humidisoli]UFJ42890.1 hypothetical protein LOK74_10525 [Brevibacillus humidisoli]
MVDFVLDHKWTFFVLGEVIFWGSILSFLFFRYWLGLVGYSSVFLLLFLASDLWLLFIGVLDYLRTGTIETFQVVIFLFLLYAVVYGKKDLARLDSFVRRRVATWKGIPLPDEETGQMKRSSYGFAHTRKELRKFAIHLLLYIVVMGGMALLFGLRSISELPAEPDVPLPVRYALSGFFQNETASFFGRIWSVVLLIDGIITLSYVVFPKKRREKSHY